MKVGSSRECSRLGWGPATVIREEQRALFGLGVPSSISLPTRAFLRIFSWETIDLD